MKTVFIEARYQGQVKLPSELVEKLPGSVMLFTTVQFLSSVPAITEQLEAAGKRVVTKRAMHAKHSGQLLGCTIKSFEPEGIDAFLYVGDGEFHPKALLVANNAPVHIYNPLSNETRVLGERDIEYIRKRKMAGLAKFLSSKNIGVIVTTKPGQCRINEAFALQEKYPDKTFYFLLDNTFNFQSLEDFSFLECYINTACPRVGYDDYDKLAKPTCNIDDIYEMNQSSPSIDESDEPSASSTLKVGPKTLLWLNRVGIYTPDDLKKIGAQKAHDMIVEAGHAPSEKLLNSLKQEK